MAATLACDRIMALWLRTDERKEAIKALEMVLEQISRVKLDVYRWKWIIIALHNALQAFMVLALRGSANFHLVKADDAEKYLAAIMEEGEPFPGEQLDFFLELYKKIKSNRMKMYVHSQPFKPTGNQTRRVKKLHSLRNDFIHFLPKGFSVEVGGMPEVVKDCLAIISFLAFESGNVTWSNTDEDAGEKVKFLLQQIDVEATAIERIYASILNDITTTDEGLLPIIERDFDRIAHELTYREQRVLEWLYGFHGEEQHTLDEIQRRWSVGEFRIKEIQAKAIDMICDIPPKVC